MHTKATRKALILCQGLVYDYKTFPWTEALPVLALFSKVRRYYPLLLCNCSASGTLCGLQAACVPLVSLQPAALSSDFIICLFTFSLSISQFCETNQKWQVISQCIVPTFHKNRASKPALFCLSIAQCSWWRNTFVFCNYRMDELSLDK